MTQQQQPPQPQQQQVTGASAMRAIRGGRTPTAQLIDGDVVLERFSGPVSLPDGLLVRGSLCLKQCPAVERLPYGLHVTGDLYLSGAGALRELPGALRVDGSLFLSGCNALGSLPADLFVGGCLYLWHCAQLAQLPSGLRIGGDAMVEDCPSLRTLPSGLEVPGKLSLTACSGLRSLPSDLRVGGDLVLCGCRRLRSIPAALLDWPENDDGRAHNVYLEGCGLSRETQRWLSDSFSQRNNVRFHTTDHATEKQTKRRKSASFRSAQAAADAWAREAGLEEDGEGVQLGQAECETLRRFLVALHSAKEVALSEVRRDMAVRVVQMVQVMVDDLDAREELERRMEECLEAEDVDKPVWALNQMAMVVAVAKARGSRQRLRELGERVMRLQVVHDHASRRTRELDFADDAGVFLCYEMALREALDLPVLDSPMHFPSFVAVRDEDLTAAKEAALAITDAQFEAWLAEWPEWQRQLEEEQDGKHHGSAAAKEEADGEEQEAKEEMKEGEERAPRSSLLRRSVSRVAARLRTSVRIT